MNKPIFTGIWGNCHIQGIAVDKENGYIYYSFTTKLIKARLDGEIVGTVDGLAGHLGCIAFNEKDGCVYGSLEYKNDIIGKGILNALNSKASFDDSFYVAKFDVTKIDRIGMSAEKNNIMTAMYLKEATDDYNGKGFDKEGNTVLHKYGCSGIDGLTFAPLPGEADKGPDYLYVAYGIYDDTNRNDNNHQILLCYSINECSKYFTAFNQKNMHKAGPSAPLHKYFVYTGNTRYGVQNLEYDKHTKALFMSVYRGHKDGFPNYSLFAADCEKPATFEFSAEINEKAEMLKLKKYGEYDEKSKTYGWHFPYGATGLFSYGDGNWLISHNRETPEGQCSYIHYYKWNKDNFFECITE